MSMAISGRLCFDLPYYGSAHFGRSPAIILLGFRCLIGYKKNISVLIIALAWNSFLSGSEKKKKNGWFFCKGGFVFVLSAHTCLSLGNFFFFLDDKRFNPASLHVGYHLQPNGKCSMRFGLSFEVETALSIAEIGVRFMVLFFLPLLFFYSLKAWGVNLVDRRCTQLFLFFFLFLVGFSPIIIIIITPVSFSVSFSYRYGVCVWAR